MKATSENIMFETAILFFKSTINILKRAQDYISMKESNTIVSAIQCTGTYNSTALTHPYRQLLKIIGNCTCFYWLAQYIF